MRLPKLFNPRIQKRILMRFGVYDKVFPVETSPSRIVPDNIIRPDYVSENTEYIPKLAEIKNETQIDGMRESCRLAGSILNQLHSYVKPGITTDDIDELVHTLSIKAGAYPSPLHYKGFPKSVCTSVNNVAVHGIPDLRPLQNGDIINVDITVFFNQYHGDCSKTFLVGDVDDKGQHLVNITEECLDIAKQSSRDQLVSYNKIPKCIYESKVNEVTNVEFKSDRNFHEFILQVYHFEFMK